MTVRFIHAADLHLGSPLQAVAQASPQIRSQLEQATYTALERIVDAAIEHEVDFLILAGDIYDRESRSVRANRFFIDQLGRLHGAGIPSYLIYGNHDPLGKHGEIVDLPSSTRVFDAQEVETVAYPTEQAPEARILGQSYRSATDSRKMYYHYAPPDASVPNIGILHTGMKPDANRYAPCSLADLQGKDNMHYWALGHVHQQRVWENGPYVAFPGIPQGRHANEPGVGGCLLVELGTGGQPDVKFVPTSPIVWRREPVPIEAQGGSPPPSNMDDLVERMRETASGLRDTDAETLLQMAPVDPVETDWRPDGFVLRWELTGRGPIHEVIEDTEEFIAGIEAEARAELGAGDPFVWTEAVRRHTAAPLPDLEQAKQEDEVVQQLLAIVEEIREDPHARSEFRETCQDIWYEPTDHEEQRADAFALTEERLDRFIDDAEEMLIDRILEQRSEHVDS